MPKAGGSSALSIVALFLDNYEQGGKQSHQAFSAKICMSLVTSCEVLYGKKILALYAFFLLEVYFQFLVKSLMKLHLSMSYWPSHVLKPLLESLTV